MGVEGWVEGVVGVKVVGRTQLKRLHPKAELLLVLSLQPGRRDRREALVVELLRRVDSHVSHGRDALGEVTKVDQVVGGGLVLHLLGGRVLGQEPLRVVVGVGGGGRLEIRLGVTSRDWRVGKVRRAVTLGAA